MADKKPMRKVTGVVSEKDKPFWIRVRDLFFAESLEEVKKNIVTDVIVPYVKNFVADSLITTIQRSIFGSDAPRSGGYTYRGGYGGLARPSASKTSYEPYYRKTSVSDLNTRLYDPIVMRSWAKAQELIEVLQERIMECGTVSINELNETLVDDKGDSRIGKITDPYFGWRSIKDFRIVQRSANEWEVVLPEPVELDKKGRTYTHEL